MRSAPPLALFFLLALAAQWFGGAYDAGFEGHPDEAAHYVTGSMVRDYIANSFPDSPMRFATNYYLHYPEVAFGHWPPVFYLLQSAWTLALPVSHGSLLVCMAGLTAVCAFLLHRAARWEFDAVAAWLGGLIFVATPVVMVSGSMVMGEIPLILFSLAAALALVRFLESETIARTVVAAILISTAILTKPSGFAVTLILPIALALRSEWRRLLSPRLWLMGSGIAALTLPFYAFTWKMLHAGMENRSITFGRAWDALGIYLADFRTNLGVVFGVFFLTGLLLYGVRRGSSRISPFWAVMLASLFASLLFHCIVPTLAEPRKNVLTVPAAILFAVAGFHWLASRARLPRPVLALAALAAYAATAFQPLHRKSSIMEDVARFLLSTHALDSGAALVSGQTPGSEGALIASIASRDDRRPHFFVLRASKLLIHVTWNGLDYRMHLPSAAAVQQALDDVPVNTLVLESDTRTPLRPHDQQLEDLVTAPSHGWQERYNRNSPDGARSVRVFRRTANLPEHPVRLQIDMQDRLGRNLSTSGR